MRSSARLLIVALLLLLALPAQAAESVPEGQLLASTDAAPMHLDNELAREHERFASFAQEQVQRMNANILGGKSSMRVHKGSDGLYRASYKAIDMGQVAFQVSRAKHDPYYFVGVMVYKELILESVGQTAEACRRGSFEPVAQTPQRVIYSSKRGGGWN
ncbi:MAG: hypothetical protein C0405_01165 [Desulfovibrio sp.]|nr:hypothetical protein [Desulfovibrio sp.]